MKQIFFAMAGILAIGLAQPVTTHAHGGEHHHGKSMEQNMMPAPGTFLVKKDIDGYQATFHIMSAPKDMSQGGSHQVMFKAEENGKPLTTLIVNSKVIHPGGQSESKMMMRMGDWYMAAYDLGHAGIHQIMVLFKTPDGKKHFVGIEYQKKGAGK